MKAQILKYVDKLPYIRGLRADLTTFRKWTMVKPGHYYSPNVCGDEIKERENEIWPKEKVANVNGVDINIQEQAQLLNTFSDYYKDIPFADSKKEGLRYFYDNTFFSYSDAILLHCMMRHFKPKRIIEIGSGYSSAVMMDTNLLFFNNSIQLTFIEPYPERLYSLMTEADKKQNKVIEKQVQQVDVTAFKALEENDILFIDSTHVSKTGSDVNKLLFEVLPVLKPGVIIHIHDIFYSFEYPKVWVYQNRNWNEDYVLRAFLMYNQAFKIKLFADYMHVIDKEAYSKMPLCYKDTGSSFWMQKLQ